MQKGTLYVCVTLTALMFGGFFGTPTKATDLGQQVQQNLQERARLEQQLQHIQRQIDEYQMQLTTISSKKNTLTNKIRQLQTRQKALKLQINVTNLKINDISNRLVATQQAIDKNNAKMELIHAQSLAVLKLVQNHDTHPLLFSFVAGSSLSDIFTRQLDYLELLTNLGGLLRQAKTLQDQLAQQKQNLADQEDQAKNLLSIKTLQQQQLASSVHEQTTLLTKTKGKESAYKNALTDKQRQAAQIKSRIYELLGVQSQIEFGRAVEIAQWASEKTGVRPAFLLAILTQESNLGKNVGTCNRPGDPPSKSWRVVMKPSRDQKPFLKITAALGRDPDTTPVSCPMHASNGKQIGWGGAMGPAQFIPSTWIGYQDKVSAITGKPADPWDIRDAFLAAALKLSADGATSQRNEWTAAMLYFSGSTNPAYSFYGDSVVSKAAQYQSDIDALNNK